MGRRPASGRLVLRGLPREQRGGEVDPGALELGIVEQAHGVHVRPAAQPGRRLGLEGEGGKGEGLGCRVPGLLGA